MIFDLYKPLRNRLRQYDASSALFAVYSFMQLLYFERSLPSKFTTQELGWKSAFDLGLFEWEFDTLAREVLANCPTYGEKKLESWKDVAHCINLIKKIENESWTQQSDIESKILYEILRIAHRQFPWQDKIRPPDLVRYLRLYRHPALSQLLLREFSLLPDQLFNVVLALAGHFTKSHASAAPMTSSLRSVDPQTAADIAARLTKTLEEHRSAVNASQSYDINWAYNPNHLRRYPLVQLNSKTIVCPVVPFLLSWLVDSIYFDLVSHAEFNSAFGAAFQSYVGEALVAADREHSFQVVPEARYGSPKQPKDSIDWILADTSGALFIECKASRMRLRGKIDLTSAGAMRKEIERLAAFVVQAYATLNDALNGHYIHWDSAGRPVYPVVVTLENWRPLRIPAEEIVDSEVKEAFAARNLDHRLLEDHPYQICSISEMEIAAQVMSHMGIERFMALRHQNGGAKTTLHGFLASALDSELKSGVAELFPDDLDALTKPLDA